MSWDDHTNIHNKKQVEKPKNEALLIITIVYSYLNKSNMIFHICCRLLIKSLPLEFITIIFFHSDSEITLFNIISIRKWLNPPFFFFNTFFNRGRLYPLIYLFLQMNYLNFYNLFLKSPFKINYFYTHFNILFNEKLQKRTDDSFVSMQIATSRMVINEYLSFSI